MDIKSVGDEYKTTIQLQRRWFTLFRHVFQNDDKHGRQKEFKVDGVGENRVGTRQSRT